MQLALPIETRGQMLLAPGYHVFLKLDGTTRVATERQIKGWLRRRKRGRKH